VIKLRKSKKNYDSALAVCMKQQQHKRRAARREIENKHSTLSPASTITSVAYLWMPQVSPRR